mmetsp:Transcript_18502/g.29365  ORF Transcript_18502/g.29365 Transcript_18502/m.29365 type:complete len:322 (-) Transcript_18502:131-1096(-)
MAVKHFQHMIEEANSHHMTITLYGEQLSVEFIPNLFTGDTPILTDFIGKGSPSASNCSHVVESLFLGQTDNHFNAMTLQELIRHNTLLARRNHGKPNNYGYGESMQQSKQSKNQYREKRMSEPTKDVQAPVRGPQFFIAPVAIPCIPLRVQLPDYTRLNDENYRHFCLQLVFNPCAIHQIPPGSLNAAMWSSLSVPHNQQVTEAIFDRKSSHVLRKVRVTDGEGTLHKCDITLQFEYDDDNDNVNLRANGWTVVLDVASSQFTTALVDIDHCIIDFLHLLENSGKYDMALAITTIAELIDDNDDDHDDDDHDDETDREALV